MRTSLRISTILTVVALALAGCSDAAAPAGDDTSAADPAPVEQTQDATPADDEATPPAETSIPGEVVLDSAAFAFIGPTPVEDTETIEAWALPEACAAGAPSTAVAELTVTYGDGEYESVVGIQQVAVFADADAATAEAARLQEALAACADVTTDSPTVYIAEEVAVGAQGMGVVVDYNGTSATGDGDAAMGYYASATRRGNAVTVVGYLGGEGSIGTSREKTVATLQSAWELLCIYDSAGCSSS